MKIAFLGDSITQGVHGYSYIKVLQDLNPTLELTNYGKGGDTISSLNKRIKKIDNLKEFDILFLFVGVNDILGKLSWFYKILKIMDKQPIAKSNDVFKAQFKDTLEYLSKTKRKIVIIPPLLIGEDIDNNWNKQITKLVKIIKSLQKHNPKVDYIDIRKDFTDYLYKKKLSDYIPLKAMDMKQDGVDIRSGVDVDKISDKRGLHLTIDGVHINTKGAKMIANSIQNYLDGYNK